MTSDVLTDAAPLPPPAFTVPQGTAAILLGVVSLLMSGLMPLFLGALSDEHRLSPAGIGELATLELLSTAVVTGLAGAALKPNHLKLIGIVGSLLLAAANAATVGAHGAFLMVIRTLAGVPEGLLLWLVVGVVARSRSPDQRAGVLFTAMAASQLVVAVILSLAVLPKFGADGAYMFVAGFSGLGVVIACILPNTYGQLPVGMEEGLPPLRGWISLFAVFIFQAAVAGASVYIVPLALQAGLSDGVAQTAISVALAFEVLGAALATLISGRVKFLDVVLFSTVVLLADLAVYADHPQAWLFIFASAAIGFCALLVMPFFVPLTIKADPSRRAAVQIGGAQLLGGAIGPVLTSLVVTDRDSHGVLYLAGAMLVFSLAIIFWLNASARQAAGAEAG
jgi:MFS family permease